MGGEGGGGCSVFTMGFDAKWIEFMQNLYSAHGNMNLDIHCEIDPFNDNCGTAVLQGKLIYFAKV